MTLDADRARHLVRIALGHVTREYPHKPALVLAGPGDVRTPAQMHPAFHGSFDWHSCVHAHWLLARLLPCDDAIPRHFDATLTTATIAAEVATIRHAPGFERPYGWAWLLKLAAELHGTRWAPALAPLASLIAERLRAFLPIAGLPVRTGSHGNTAFALRLAADYADMVDPSLLPLLRATALAWYAEDRACPAWGEPGGDDFLSPTLIEAECMRRLHPDTFPAWFAGFLPGLAQGRPATLFHPATPTDRTDGKIAHLDGLNLSRAWCFRALATALPDKDPTRPLLHRAADAHLAAALPQLEADYMGEHWLATFALLALDASAA